MIEIYLLEQLAEFKKGKTLSRAAEKLSISQPALSRSMQKLEDKIGVPLFERRRNRITLPFTSCCFPERYFFSGYGWGILYPIHKCRILE